MKQTNALSLARQVKIDYQARFGDYDIQASKLASQSGAGRAFQARLQSALDSNTPMDFNGFVKELLMPSADG